MCFMFTLAKVASVSQLIIFEASEVKKRRKQMYWRRFGQYY